MSFLPKRQVLDNIKVRTVAQSRDRPQYDVYEAYFGINPFTGKPVRKYAMNRVALERRVTEFFKNLESGGDVLASLTHYQAVDAKQALDLLEAARCQISLADCVRKYLAGEAPAASPKAAGKSISTGDAYSQYLDSVADKSELYQRDVRSRVGKWVDAFGSDRDLSEVSAPEVKKYLMDTFYRKGDIGSWVTYNNVLRNIKTFARWCASREQGFLASDPLDGMKQLVIPYRQPEYMKAADVKKVFDVLWARRADPAWAADLAYAVLSFFCGMRQSEIERVRLGADAVKINLSERFVRVGIPKGVSKGIRPRTFVLPKQAHAWMAAFDFMGAVVRKNDRFRRHLTWAAKDAGVTLPKNVGRHTFITMFEAVHHDQSALTAIVGNTDDVRAKSYNGVELRPEGEAYFKILPPSASAAPSA